MNRITTTSLATIILLVLITPSLAAESAGPLDGVRCEHPRLLFTIADQKRIEELAKTDALLARLIEQNLVNATKMLDEPPIRYHIPDGKRLLGQSRRCIERVASMAMAYRLSGERKYAEGAIKEMLTAAKFKDWNPSHFLDTAEMATALAIGYDWLYDVIEPEDKTTIRRAIAELGLKPGMKCYEGDRWGWWTKRDNNWNQVCNGGMLLGSLAICEHEKKLANESFAHALKSIPPGISVYGPDGAYPEGPVYWTYGTIYTALTVMALETATGADGGIPETPGMDRTGAFRIHTIGPTGLYFNYADCKSTSQPQASMFALSKVCDRPLWAWWHRQELAGDVPLEGELKPKRLSRFFPFEIAWYDPRGEEPTGDELPLAALFKGRQDVVTMRTAWNDPEAVYVGFKGGDNRTNHGHLDIGSFVLDAGGVRWALDLGGDNYNMPGYFGGRRWEYYRLLNQSHNTLVIDGKKQNTKAKAKVVSFETKEGRTTAFVDMSDAYKDQAKSSLRGIELFRTGMVRIRDEIEKPVGEVRWGMVTAADIKVSGNKAVLSQDGKALHAKVVSPPGAKFEIVSTKPPTDRENQNNGTRMLAVKAKAQGEKKLVIEVFLEKMPIFESQETPTLKPLGEWE